MTSNQLRNSELKETQRANLEREANEAKKRIIDRKNLELTRRGQDMNFAGNITQGIIKKIPVLNHPSWYKGVGGSALTAANIPGYYPLGIAYKDNAHKSKALVTATHVKITVADLLPISRDGKPDINSGLSYMALKNFKFVRSKNSGSANYESVDLMMKDLSLISIAGGIAAAIRELRLSLTSNDYNRSIMTALSNVSATDFADYITLLNKQIARFNDLYLPNIFPVLARKLWLYSNVFADDSLNKTQWIKVMPQFIWRYDETNGKLVCQKITDGPDIMDNLINAITASIDALYTSESVDIMTGDEMKAYGDSGNFYFNDLDVNLPDIAPIYDDEIIQQLRSNTLLPGYCDDNDFDVYQLNGNLIYQGTDKGFFINMFNINTNLQRPDTIESDFDYSYDKVILNFLYDTFSVDDVLTASRFGFIGLLKYPDDKRHLAVHLMSAGSELITSYKVGFIGKDGVQSEIDFIDHNVSFTSTVKTYSFKPEEIIILKQLDTLPTIPMYQWDGSVTGKGKFEIPLLVTPLDNFNIIEKKTVGSLNEVCNESLFGMVATSSAPHKSDADGSWKGKKSKKQSGKDGNKGKGKEEQPEGTESK